MGLIDGARPEDDGRQTGRLEQAAKELRDLMAFIPIWLDSISMRRALVLKRSSDNTIPAGE